MKNYIDLTNIYNKYKGLWVALTPDETKVISYDKKAKIAYQKSKQKGFKQPILFKVPTKILPFVGN